MTPMQTAFDEKTVSLIKQNKILSKEHLPLIVDRVRVCEYAGIDLKHLTHSMKQFCTKKDYQFIGMVKKCLRGNSSIKGYVVDLQTNPSKTETSERLRGMAGALARNYISSKVVPSKMFRDDPYLDVEVLLIPDFCISGEPLPEWIRDTMAGNLYARIIENKLTVIAVSSADDFIRRMGKNVMGIVGDHYTS